MDITLCMVVKNEIRNLQQLLKPSIKDQFEEIIVVDTGSNDGTKEFLLDCSNIRLLESKILESTASSKSPCRNLALSKVKTDWVMSLDADERVDVDDLKALQQIKTNKSISGYFATWKNYVANNKPFLDYKLFLYRKGVIVRGMIHENATVDLRIKNKEAIWSNEFSVDHFPDPDKHRYKTNFYEQRLFKAISIDPNWARNYWFLGYMRYQTKNYDEALIWLKKCVSLKDKRFPVETLNSLMCIAQINILLEDKISYFHSINEYKIIYQQEQNDFEVKINQHLHNFFELTIDTKESWETGWEFLPEFAR